MPQIRGNVASNILLEKLPDTLNVGGAEYMIDTDFRTAIRFTLLMQDKRANQLMRLDLVLKMFYIDAIPEDLIAAVYAILDFYGGAKTAKESEHSTQKRVFDFDVDADLIYAAFLSQYGIDLLDIDYMHWWKFKALFAGLSEDTEIMKVIGYRSIKITNDMSSEQKKRYRKLKSLYALPDNRTEEEKEQVFAANLLRL